MRPAANFLHINIYLTQKIGEDMLWNIAVNGAGAEYDPLTLLRTRTMFGRPNWKSIYRRIREAIEVGQYLPGSNSQLKTKVGVSLASSRVFFLINSWFVSQTYFCGPGVLARDIKAATVMNSSNTVEFTFAKVCFPPLLHINPTLMFALQEHF